MQILNRYTDYSHSKGARKNFQYAAGRSSKVTLSQSILPTTDCQLVCLSAHSKWWWIACAYEVCTKAIRKIDSVEPHIITSLWQYALCNRCIITRKLKLFVCMHIASHACKPASDGKAPCELPTKKKSHHSPIDHIRPLIPATPTPSVPAPPSVRQCVVLHHNNQAIHTTCECLMSDRLKGLPNGILLETVLYRKPQTLRRPIWLRAAVANTHCEMNQTKDSRLID